MDSLFNGKFIIREECKTCNTKAFYQEKFINLDLTITDLTVVKELYEYMEVAYLHEREISKLCGTCHNKLFKKHYIYDLPNYLIVIFKDARISDEKKEVILNKKFDLKYDPSCIFNPKEKFIKVKDSGTNEESFIEVYDRDDSYYQYEIVSGIRYERNDYDSSYSFMSFHEINTTERNENETLELNHESNESKPKWIEFNEDNVHRLGTREFKFAVLEKLVKGEPIIVDNPLVLVYERRRKMPMKKVLIKEAEKSTITKRFNKSDKAALKKSIDIFHVDNLYYLNRRDSFFDNTFILNEATNEITYYDLFESMKSFSNYQAIEIFIDEINKDNNNFEVEKMIFGKYFIKFLENFTIFVKNYCIANKEVEDKSTVKKLFKLCLELFYEIPVRNCEISVNHS